MGGWTRRPPRFLPALDTILLCRNAFLQPQQFRLFPLPKVATKVCSTTLSLQPSATTNAIIPGQLLLLFLPCRNPEPHRSGRGRVPLVGSPDALWQILQLTDNIRASPDLKAALAIHWAFLEGNFARFFRLARELPYLPSCALHPHLAKTRRLALLAFSHGFNAKNCRYPLARLTHLLAIDSPEEAADLCRAHGLTVIEKSVVFQKGSFRDSAPLENRTSCLLVDRKGEGTLLDLSERVCS